MEIASVDHMEAAARELQRRTGCGAVLVKGGHLHAAQQQKALASAGASPPDGASSCTAAAGQQPAEVVDVLFDGREVHRLSGPAYNTNNTHGTGELFRATTGSEAVARPHAHNTALRG